MTESFITHDTTQVQMSPQQLSQLITTVAAALRQTTSPLTAEQQTVALQFRLLRNGLGRFSSVSEGFDQALIRVDQVHDGARSVLVFHDPIPDAARAMVLVVGSRRVAEQLPGVDGDGRHRHGLGGGLEQVVERVELLDQLEVPIAVGVPRQLHVRDQVGDPFSEPVGVVVAQDPLEQPARYAKPRQSKTPES